MYCVFEDDVAIAQYSVALRSGHVVVGQDWFVTSTVVNPRVLPDPWIAGYAAFDRAIGPAVRKSRLRP